MIYVTKYTRKPICVHRPTTRDLKFLFDYFQILESNIIWDCEYM